MLSRRLVALQEAERREISRELHDEVGQVLTGLMLMLEASGQPTQGHLSPSGEKRAKPLARATRSTGQSQEMMRLVDE